MKRIVTLLIALSLLLCASGISALAEEPLTIGFCNYTDTADFFITVKESMQRVCDEKGYTLLYAVSDYDPTKMRSAWDAFVTQGANIIVDFSLLSDSGSTMAKNFKDQYGIDVICVDNVYENAYFFGVNNQGAGETAGTYIAEKVKEKWDGQVDCMLQFYLESNGPVVKLRNSGIYDAMVASGIELSEDNVTWINASGAAAAGTVDPAVMKSLVTDYLTAHPDDHHIVIACFNDDGGNAAYNAVKASGREDDVLLISHNADPVAVDTMKSGETFWVGTVCYSPNTYGDQIIALAERILAGEEVPTETYANTFVIDASNVNEYFAD